MRRIKFQGEGGLTYEATYRGWLGLFKEAFDAVGVDGVVVVGAPLSWVPFLRYMGARTEGPRRVFEADELLGSARLVYAAIERAEKTGQVRELVEHYSTLRPELADAIWKYDMQWQRGGHREETAGGMTLVTGNASFGRAQFRRYMDQDLPGYRAESPLAIIVPCAADKPYPSRLHSLVRAAVPDGDIIIATGVLGLIPEALWPIAPLYDSGVPNTQRVVDTCRWFFRKHQYGQIVVYSDFYAEAVSWGLGLAGVEEKRVSYVFGDHRRFDYEDLTDPMHLRRLQLIVAAGVLP